MFHSSSLLSNIEVLRCTVSLAFKGQATSAQRCVAFLDQFLEPFSRFGSVTVENPQLKLVEVLLPRIAQALPKPAVATGGGRLRLTVLAEERLGALLHWAAKRTNLHFHHVTVVYRHATAASIVDHHGLDPVPTLCVVFIAPMSHLKLT